VQKKVVLFVCTHNSARSQLAEAILRQKYHEYYQVFSAGTQPTGINPYILQILIDMGIDTSKLESKHVNTFLGKEIDFVAVFMNRTRAAKDFLEYIFVEVLFDPPLV